VIGIRIEIKERARIEKALNRLASDRALYTDMILGAYSRAIDQAFRTQGFRTWPPLKPKTIKARRKGRGGDYESHEGARNHYLLPPAAGVTPGFPANTWTARMRDFVAGRTTSFSPLNFGRGTQNIRIRGGPRYAGYALDLRPLSDQIMEKVAKLMEGTIRAGIIKNVEIAVQ